MQTHPTRRPRRAAAAFSILELLLVLVILAILAGIVGVRFAGQSQKASITATRTQLENFRKALSMYELDLGRYPSASEGLDALIEAPADAGEDWKGKYLEATEVPLDAWKHAWNYRQPGTHNPEGYDLWSNGPDGVDGSDDDIANWAKK